MTNPRFNQQVANRRGAMGGGMMKRSMYKDGSLKMVEKGGKKVPFFAADGKGAKDLGKADRMMAKKGSIPPQLKKFVMAKKKKAKMKNKKKVIG